MGRRAELGTFDELWVDVTHGRRQAVFVGGEPGAGKTRLLAEIATVLAQHDATVLMGSSAADVSVAYQPFVEMLDHLFGSAPPGSLVDLLDDTATQLLRLTSRVAPHLPDGGRDQPSGDLRRDLFDATAHLFRSLSDVRPVVLVFDDLHWAEAPTLALLSHLIATAADARMLVVGGFRTTSLDRSDDLTLAIADLYRLAGVRRLDLAGLDTDEIAEYLRITSGVGTTDARGAAPLLRDQTGGNPFFLRELWRELLQRGGLPALRAGRVPAPRSVGDTLERRLASLPAVSRDVLEAAAVLGDPFDVSTLAATSSVDATQVLAALDAADAMSLVGPSAEDAHAFTFLHALSRQAVLDRLSPSRRVELHARAAGALQPRAAEPEVVPHLAHHYLRCHVLGFEEEGVREGTRAAHLAERSLAFEEAAAWFERAAAIPGVAADERTRLLLAAGSNQVRAGQFERARTTYDQLASSGDPRTRLAAAMGYEDASWRPGRIGARSADLLMEAMEATALPVDDPHYIAALASLGRALTFAGEAARAERVGARAIELAEEHGDEALRSHARLTSLWHGLQPDRAHTQLARAAEVVQRARAMGDQDMLQSSSYFWAMASYVLGRPDQLRAAIQQFHQSTDVASGPFQQFVGGCLELGQSFLRGDLAGARAQAEELLARGETFGADSTQGLYGLQVFMIQRETGGLGSVAPLITGDEPLHGRWPAGLLALYTELGLEAGMRRVLPHMLAALDEQRTAGAQWPSELAFTTEAALALKDTDALEQVEPHLARYEGLNLVTGEFVAVFGAADRYLARIASLRGDDDRAERLFAAALAMDEGMGSVVHTAETLLHHARHLLSTGEATRARTLFERARELAEPIGQERVLRQLPPRTGPERSDGLSDREVEVLALLAEGLSNREIGERLYISANTAANHVRSILMKTGAVNRTQAAMYAADQHLV